MSMPEFMWGIRIMGIYTVPRILCPTRRAAIATWLVDYNSSKIDHLMSDEDVENFFEQVNTDRVNEGHKVVEVIKFELKEVMEKEEPEERRVYHGRV